MYLKTPPMDCSGAAGAVRATVTRKIRQFLARARTYIDIDTRYRLGFWFFQYCDRVHYSKGVLYEEIPQVIKL